VCCSFATIAFDVCEQSVARKSNRLCDGLAQTVMMHTSMARTIREAGQVVQMCGLSCLLLLLLLLLLLPFHSPHVILAWFYPTPSVTDDRRERNNVVSTVSRF
jgi:hypothetical protein